MSLLAIETSCDETSIAIVDAGVVKSTTVSSQIRLHAEYGGVVPELAAREHLRNLLPMARLALEQSGVAMNEIDAVAVTRGPGLPNALLTGLKAAQGLAFALRKPLIGIHHHEAHLFSPWIGGQPLRGQFEDFQPNISLIVSGGHTLLVHVRSEDRFSVLGSTVDDAAGECFDKTAKLMGLAYPGGPEIDRLSARGNPLRFDFPKPMMRDPGNDFSFSGLKTAVRYFIRDHPALLESPQDLYDVCASIQHSIVETLVTKTLRAAERMGLECVTASGGVTCNRTFRESLTRNCGKVGIELRLAEKSVCTDNAAMVGILAERKLARGVSSDGLDDEILPGWELPQKSQV